MFPVLKWRSCRKYIFTVTVNEWGLMFTELGYFFINGTIIKTNGSKHRVLLSIYGNFKIQRTAQRKKNTAQCWCNQVWPEEPVNTRWLNSQSFNLEPLNSSGPADAPTQTKKPPAIQGVTFPPRPLCWEQYLKKLQTSMTLHFTVYSIH